MDTSFSLRLQDISYTGANIGNDWEFTITVAGQTTQFPAQLSFGASRIFDKLLFESSGDPAVKATITLPVLIGAVERDPSFDDTGGAAGNVTIDLNRTTTQTFQLAVSVMEIRNTKSSQQASLVFTFAAQMGTATPVTLGAITPGRGPLAGGTAVTLTGTGFQPGTQVLFGKKAAQSVEYVDDKTLKAVSPASDDAGAVTVKVETPAGKKASLTNAFIYQGKPEISYIDPNEGPVQPAAAQPYFVFIYGANFQKDAVVLFGENEGKMVEVTEDGARIKVALPDGDQPGAVDVRVQNPDGTKAKKEKAFTYLAKDDKGRARIRKFSPLQIIDGTEITMNVTGRRLIEANKDKLFCLRAPETLDLTMGPVTTSVDNETGEETLTFTLKVKSKTILFFVTRTMIQFMASVREHAVDDLVAEENDKFLVVLPARGPVPLAYTSAIGAGESQMLIVAGRNLKGSSLKLTGNKGIEVMESHSEDKLSLLMIRVTDPAVVVPGNLEVRTSTGSRVGKYPLKMQSGIVTQDGNDNPEIAPLVQIPGQRIVAPQKGRSRAYLVRDNSLLKRSDPKFTNNSNLIADFKFRIETFELQIPVLDDLIFFNTVDRGGKEELLAKGIDLSVGRMVRVRNLDFLVALQVNLVIRTEVFLFLFGNPFTDYNSDAPFNFFSGPSDGFGSIVTSLETSTTFGFEILFYAALVMPPAYNATAFDPMNPGKFPEVTEPMPRKEGLKLTRLASFSLDLEIQNDTPKGGMLMLGAGFYVRVVLPLNEYVAKVTQFQSDGLQLLAQFAYPDIAGKGLVTYFFARKAGQYCFDWERDKGLRVKLGLLSTGEEDDLEIPVTTTFCLDVKDNKDQNVLRPVPKEPKLEVNASQLVWVYRANPDEKKGTETPVDDPVDPATYTLVSSDPTVFTAVRDDSENKEGSLRDWYLFGKKEGKKKMTIVVNPNVSTSAPGTISAGRMAFFPKQDISFDVYPNVLLGLFPAIILGLAKDKDFEVKVEKAKNTPGLQMERNRLWKNYVAQTSSEKDPAKAWKVLPDAAKGIFLVTTHRLHFSKFDYTSEDEVAFLQLKGQSMSAQTVLLLALRGANDQQPENNRLLLLVTSSMAKGLLSLAQKKTDALTLADVSRTADSSEKALWISGKKEMTPFGLSVTTPGDRLPLSLAYLFDSKSYLDDRLRNDMKKLAALLATLKGQTKPSGIFNDQLIEKQLEKPVREGSEVCVIEVPQVIAVNTDFGKNEYSTEPLAQTVKVENKNLKTTGRRLYDFYYGTEAHPIDLGWAPQECTGGDYQRNGEELRGNGVEDDLIAVDKAGLLEGLPEMKTLVSTFSDQLKTIGKDAAAKEKLKTLVADSGKKILARARAAARNKDFLAPDDRPLYWARIKMSVLLKKHPYMLCAVEADRQEIIRAFETHSRGYDDIVFPAGENKLRVILTGFDPYLANSDTTVRLSNPSGASALALHGMKFEVGGKELIIQAPVFPIRHADFDQDCGAGVVEATLHRFISDKNPGTQIHLCATSSVVLIANVPSKPLLYIDRFAIRKRAPNLDNEEVSKAKFRMLMFPASLPGDEFYATALPVAKIVPPKAEGPNFRIIYRNNFTYTYGTGEDFKSARFQPMDDSIYEGPKGVEERGLPLELFMPPVPSALSSTSTPRKEDITGIEGSGGSFLSNEIFYRVSRLRAMENPTLMSGHLHLPNVQRFTEDFQAAATRNVVLEVKDIIRRCFLPEPGNSDGDFDPINVT